MTTEESLINAIQDGDRSAQRELYCRYAGTAMAVAVRYMGNQEEARDVLQDSFVKILTSVGRFHFRGEGSLKAWLTRIVANEAVSHLRSAHHQLFLSDEPNIALKMADEQEEEPDVGGLTPEMLTMLISQLPPGYRTVLNLYAIEGLSHDDIARKLGITASTSASQYLRAKKALAKMIKKESIEGK